jgi:hypothetical protein
MSDLVPMKQRSQITLLAVLLTSCGATSDDEPYDAANKPAEGGATGALDAGADASSMGRARAGARTMAARAQTAHWTARWARHAANRV